MTSIEPELWVERSRDAIAFYEAAFGATVLHRVGDGDDLVAQLAVGGPVTGFRAHPRITRVPARIGAPPAGCCWWSTTRTPSSRRHAPPVRRSCLRSGMSMAGGSAGSRIPQ